MISLLFSLLLRYERASCENNKKRHCKSSSGTQTYMRMIAHLKIHVLKGDAITAKIIIEEMSNICPKAMHEGCKCSVHNIQ